MDTLKVKMNVSIASADWSFAPGDVIELDVELAHAWLESGHALKIDDAKLSTTKLGEGVEYLGFGNFSAYGQVVRGKKEANDAAKEIPAEIVEAYKLAKEESRLAAEEKARIAAEEEARLAAEAGGVNAD